MWRGVDAATVRDLRAAGMSISKQEATGRADGSLSDFHFDVSFEGDLDAFHALRLRAETLHVSLIQPHGTARAAKSSPRRAARAAAHRAAARS
jgi:hypothetical protein